MKSYFVFPVILVSLMVLFAGGCASGKKKPPEVKTDELTTIKKTGFFDDYSNLQPGRSPLDPLLVWQHPNKPFFQYNKWLIEPVEFWGMPGEKARAKDQQRLVDKMYHSMVKALSQRFEVVTEPGFDVMRVRLAIVDDTADPPILKTKSSSAPVVAEPPSGTPQLARYVTTQILFKDSQGDEIIRKVIDRRFTADDKGRPERWADVYATVDHYASTLVYRFCLLRYEQDCEVLRPPEITLPSKAP